MPGLGGQGARISAAQIACAASVLVTAAPAATTPHVALVCWRFAGALVIPAASVLSCQQLPGAWLSLISARSPLVGLANDPLPVNVLWATSLPQSWYKQALSPSAGTPLGSPPTQWATAGGVSVSGNGTGA